MDKELKNRSGSFSVILSSLAVALVLTASVYLVYTALFVILIYVAWKRKGNRRFVLPGVIVILLVSSSDIVQNYRVYINIGAYLTAFLMFFEAYGLDYKNYPVLPERLLKFMAGFILLLFFSALLSERPLVGFVFVLKQTAFFLLIYLTYADVKWRKNPHLYIKGLILTGSILSMAIIISFLTSDSAVYYLMTKSMIKEGGIFGNVSAAAAILLITLTLTILKLSLANKDNNKRLFYGLMLFFQSIGLLMTNSRAALLGFYFSLAVVIFYINKKYFKIYITVSLVAVIVIFLGLPEKIDFLINYVRVERILENERWKLWHVAENIIRDHPFFGAGPGQFKYYIYYYNPTMLGTWEELQMRWVHDLAGLGHAHNIFLFLTSELGIGGLFSILAFFYVFYYYGSRKVEIKYYFYKIAVVAAGTGLFIRSFFESTGILTYGWIIRDLPLWTLFILLIYFTTENQIPEIKLKDPKVKN